MKKREGTIIGITRTGNVRVFFVDKEYVSSKAINLLNNRYFFVIEECDAISGNANEYRYSQPINIGDVKEFYNTLPKAFKSSMDFLSFFKTVSERLMSFIYNNIYCINFVKGKEGNLKNRVFAFLSPSLVQVKVKKDVEVPEYKVIEKIRTPEDIENFKRLHPDVYASLDNPSVASLSVTNQSAVDELEECGYFVSSKEWNDSLNIKEFFSSLINEAIEKKNAFIDDFGGKKLNEYKNEEHSIFKFFRAYDSISNNQDDEFFELLKNWINK